MREMQFLQSRPSGSATVVTPRMWCFMNLLFLQDFVKARKGVCNITETENRSQNISDIGELESQDTSEMEDEENNINIIIEEVPIYLQFTKILKCSYIILQIMTINTILLPCNCPICIKKFLKFLSYCSCCGRISVPIIFLRNTP